MQKIWKFELNTGVDTDWTFRKEENVLNQFQIDFILSLYNFILVAVQTVLKHIGR